MNAPVSIYPKGTQFARVALMLARCKGDRMHAQAQAEAAWGPTSIPAMILRAAVAAGNTADTSWAGALSEHRVAAAEFVEALRPLTVLGRMTGFRRPPMNVKFPRVTTGSSVGWVGESRVIKVSRMALDTMNLDHFKICGIVVSTLELIRLATPDADNLVRTDLLAAVAAMQDRALLDPSAAASDVSPASITAGAAQIASSGSTAAQISSDLEKLFKVLVDAGCNMLAPYFITTPRLAFKLALKRDASGGLAFPGMGAKGGEIGGVPVLVTGNSPEGVSGDSPGLNTGNIVLVDAAEMLVADTNEIALDMSTQSNVQLDDAPDSPPTTGTNIISLWQHNLAGWKVVRPINWQMRRDGAVAVLTGCVY